MRKLYLIFHGRFPSEKAASLFAAKSAESFADSGFAVEVIVPKRKGADTKEVHAFYSVKNNFSVTELPIIDVFGTPFKKIAFWVSYITFSKACLRYLKDKISSEDILYSNEIVPLSRLSSISANLFYEMHDFPESKLGVYEKMLSKMRWILIHNKWKLEEAIKLFPTIPRSKFLYEPNAVDTKVFDVPITKEEARKRLGLPLSKKIAVYTGHLYGWKGVDTLAAAANRLSQDFLVIFVGGTPHDVLKFERKYGSSSKIMIAGWKSHEEIPLWQKSADVLVLPNTAKEKISAYYTSPMKLFEYMASKKPIISSDIPSIREILTEKEAMLVEADNPDTMAHAIESVMKAPKIGEEMAMAAFNKVQDHTWKKRAGRIVTFLNK